MADIFSSFFTMILYISLGGIYLQMCIVGAFLRRAPNHHRPKHVTFLHKNKHTSTVDSAMFSRKYLTVVQKEGY